MWSIPGSQLLLQGSAFQKRNGRSPAQQRSSSPSTQETFIYIWNYPPKSVSVLLLHSNAPAAVTGITEDTYLFKINSQNVKQFPVPTIPNHKHKPKIPGQLRKADPEKLWHWIRWTGGILLLFGCNFQGTCILPLQNTLNYTRKPLFYLNTHP